VCVCVLSGLLSEKPKEKTAKPEVEWQNKKKKNANKSNRANKSQYQVKCKLSNNLLNNTEMGPWI